MRERMPNAIECFGDLAARDRDDDVFVPDGERCPNPLDGGPPRRLLPGQREARNEEPCEDDSCFRRADARSEKVEPTQ